MRQRALHGHASKQVAAEAVGNRERTTFVGPDVEPAFEIRAPDRIGCVVLTELVAVAGTCPTSSPSLLDQSVAVEDLSNGARRRQEKAWVFRSDDCDQFPGPPGRVLLTGGDEQLNNRRIYRSRIRVRSPRAILQ